MYTRNTSVRPFGVRPFGCLHKQHRQFHSCTLTRNSPPGPGCEGCTPTTKRGSYKRLVVSRLKPQHLRVRSTSIYIVAREDPPDLDFGTFGVWRFEVITSIFRVSQENGRAILLKSVKNTVTERTSP